MTVYETLKTLHVACVALSIALFVYRFILISQRNERLTGKWLKLTPHVNDSVLLAAAIGMLVVARTNPLELDWLKAKIVALLVYIALGSFCIRAKPRSARAVSCFVLAVCVFTYIAYVALTKDTLLSALTLTPTVRHS